MQNQSTQSTGRDIFFYLLSFFTLGTAAISLGGVIFAIINKYFSDQVINYYGGAGPSAGALAALIVATPIYLLVTAKINKDLAAGLTSATSKVRKILTYLVLFLACATVIGDVIGLVYQFVAGEVNTRVLLKIATILILGLWVMWYYWVNIKNDEAGSVADKKSWWHKGHLIGAIVVTLIAIVTGFIMIGSPAFRQKLVRDNQRVVDLQQIGYSVQDTYNQTEPKVLPSSLAAIPLIGYKAELPKDPLTKMAYEYKVLSDKQYELCAVFEAVSEQMGMKYARPVYAPDDVYALDWSHPAGKYCYKLQVVKTPVSK
ncbi:MAG: DUF5671 domain-containing protein [Patescibacteria group bacterium]